LHGKGEAGHRGAGRWHSQARFRTAKAKHPQAPQRRQRQCVALLGKAEQRHSATLLCIAKAMLRVAMRSNGEAGPRGAAQRQSLAKQCEAMAWQCEAYRGEA